MAKNSFLARMYLKMFFKTGVLKNFANFTRKQHSW